MVVLTLIEMPQRGAKAARLRYRNGKRSVIDASFTEAKVLIDYACIRVARVLRGARYLPAGLEREPGDDP